MEHVTSLESRMISMMLDKIGSLPSLLLTHLKSNWKRGMVISFGVFIVMLILNDALFLASSLSAYQINRQPPNNAFVPDWGAKLHFQASDINFLQKGFQKDSSQLKQEFQAIMEEAMQKGNLHVKDDLSTYLGLDINGYLRMKDLTSDPSYDETFLQVDVIGLDESILEHLGLSTTGASIIVLDLDYVNVVINEDVSNDVHDEYLPENDTILGIIDPSRGTEEGLILPYNQFGGANTSYIYEYWIGELYDPVLKPFLKENSTIKLRIAPTHDNVSLLTDLVVSDVFYHSVPQLSSFGMAQSFYESSSLLTTLVALDLISGYSDQSGFFIIVPFSTLYDLLDGYFLDHSLQNSPFSSANGELYYEQEVLDYLLVLYDFSLDIEYYLNHLEELPSHWFRTRDGLQQDLGTMFNDFIPPPPSNMGPAPVIVDTSYHVGRLYSPYTIDSRISGALSAFFFVTFVLLILGIPVIILSFLAGNFAVNLAKWGLYQQVSIYKIRGMTSRQVFALMFLELLLMIALGTIASFLGAIPVTLLLLSSRNFLVFDFSPLPLVVPMEWLSRVIIIGIVLGIVFRIRMVFKLSRSPLKQSELIPLEEEPYWKRKNLDLVILAWGVVGMFFFMNLRTIVTYNLPGALIFLLGLMLLPSPIALLIGGIMFLNRFVPLVLQLLKKLAVKMDLGLPILVMRDMTLRKHVVARAILLIAYGMATATLVIGFPSNILYQDQRFQLYSVGSDFAIAHALDPQFKQNLMGNLSQFDVKIMEWQYLSSYMELKLNNGSIVTLAILGVNTSTFEEVAFFEPDFGLTTLGLHDAMKQLHEQPMTTVLISALAKKRLSLTLPTNLTFSSQNVYPFNMTTLKVVDEFRYWPRLVDHSRALEFESEFYDPYDTRTELVLVSDIRFTQFLANVSSLADKISKQEGYYLKVNGDLDTKDEVSYRLSKMNVSFEAAHAGLLIKNLEFTRMFFSIVNAFLVIALVILSVVIILLALVYQRERWKEMGVERTLGMSKKQLYAYNMISTITMNIIGIGIGLTMGLLLLGAFLNILITFSTGILPPMRVVLPISELLVFLVACGIFIGMGALLSVYISSRRSISNILKTE